MLYLKNIKTTFNTISCECFNNDNNESFKIILNKSDLEIKKLSISPNFLTRQAHAKLVSFIDKNGVENLPEEMISTWG